MGPIRIRALLIAGILCVFSPLQPFGLCMSANADGIEDTETGTVGTPGADTINSAQPVGVNAVLEMTSDEDVTTAAAGIDGLAGDDQITGTADITTNASSRIVAPYVPMRIDGTASKASSKGIGGGDGLDTLLNTASIFPTSISYTEIMEIIAQIALGVNEWPTTATADSVGIEGGDGPDHVQNDGVVNAAATSETLVKEAHISALDIPIDGRGAGDNRTIATSITVAIQGDMWTGTPSLTPGAVEIIINHGSLSAISNATSTTAQGMVELIGAARVDDSTIASAYSAGIVAGVNDSLITNYQTIHSEAVSSVNMESVELKMKGLMMKSAFDVLGFDVGTFRTAADSTAIGIAGDTGNDTIVNEGTGGAGAIDVYGSAKAGSQVDTYSISPPLGTSSSGSAAAAVMAGSLSPEGLPAAPTISQTGDDGSSPSYGDASTVATSSTAGILGGAGNDTIRNNVFLTSRAESEANNISLSVDVSLGETSYFPLPGAAIADTSTTAVATSSGIDGGTGNDTITNSSGLDASAAADANSLGISATIKGAMKGLAAGVAVTDSSSTSTAASKGITGGTGGDTIANTQSVTSTASSSGESTSVSVTVAGDEVGVAVGVTLADATTRAIASSWGIDGENAGGDESTSVASQSDVIANEGQIQSTAGSAAHGDAVGISLAASLEGVSVSVALTQADVASEAYATGIRSGVGRDTIENRGPAGIDANSTATSSSNSISVAVSGGLAGVAMGASVAQANTEATAEATGIDAGASADMITNSAGIQVSSRADVSSNAISVTTALAPKGFSAGVAFSETQTNSGATSTGIEGGDGDDTIENASVISASSSATTKTKAVTIDFVEAGAAIADVSSEAKAESTGADGGNGVDNLTNAGSLIVAATSVSDDTSASANLLGYARGDIESTSTATAAGMSGGSGTAGEAAGDTLTNASGASITATSTANAYADNYVVQGGGAEFANVGSKTDARAVGMEGGARGDTITNDGTMLSLANSQIKASSFSFELLGVQAGSVGVNAVGTAVGIDGCSGDNVISNGTEGQISTYADLDTTALNTEASVGAQFVGSGVTAEAYSRGIVTGDGADQITNRGSIDATANSLGEAGGASIGLIALSMANAIASADIQGINSGGGDDAITNEGTIRAGEIKAGDSYLVKADTTAVAFDLFSLVSSSLGASAQITGIEGGAGRDTIVNTGTIFIGDEPADDACTSSRAMVIGKSYGLGGDVLGMSLAFAGSSAQVSSLGIDGGDGDDLLMNSGSITVKARSHAEVDAETYVALGLLNSLAHATSASDAQATGMAGGDGSDVIENHGTISADALTISDAASNAAVDVLSNPYAESEAKATATASGIDGGSQGSKVLSNFGTISAVANAGARPYAFSESEFMRTHGEGYGLAQSQAFGITSSDVSNVVTNHDTGSISVRALAGTYDTVGNIGYADVDEDATIDAGYYDSVKGQWTPLSARSAGISLLDGNDIVVNDGSITVSSLADGSVYARTYCWTRYPFSTARSVVLGEAKGIAAGGGSNEVTNNGQLTVEASSYAAPKVYSWSRDYQATANAYGVSDAVAIGMEADGVTTNSLTGVLDVTARATSWANAPTNSEFADANALLNATATGFATFTDTGLTELQRIINDGAATVRALAGEDGNGLSQQIAWVSTNITTRDSTANSRGTSAVDAAGIRVGDGLKEITNNGTLTVLGRARADLTTAGGDHTYARSYYYNPEANSYATGVATATGILAAAGENHIGNYGTMDVQALTQDVYAWSESYSSWSTCYSTAQTNATAAGKGISVGSGDDAIKNVGSLTVASSANSKSYAYADTRDNNIADEYETSKATSEAVVIGIDGGAGRNTIENEGDLHVSAAALAQVYVGGGHAQVTATTASTASATGITAGDGGSYIKNSGTIDVEAEAHYTQGTPTLTVSTVGILGGGGNDLIVNEGTITTSMHSGVWSAGNLVAGAVPGIGIDAGAGNDTIVLADGSSIDGGVDLGTGDDTLALTGSPIVNGRIVAGVGTDTLLLDGSGFLGHNLQGFSHAMKQGAGTYAVSGLSPLARMEIAAGTLEIDSDYQFSEAGLFTTVARPNGDCGQLKIVGTGDLAGTLAVTREQGFYRARTTYDIVAAGALNGSFGEVQLPAATALLEFSMHQGPDRVQISVTPQRFASVASNEEERTIGEYLDRIAPDATGGLSNMLGAFQVLSPDGFSAAFAGLGPASYESTTTTTFDVTSQYTQTLVKRTHSMRSHIQSTDPNLAYSQTDKHAIWMEGFGHRARQDSQDGFAGYDYDVIGVAVGADQLLEDGVLAGISYAQSDTDIDMDGDLGTADIESYFGSLYGSYFTDRMYVDASLSYGWQGYENVRAVEVGTLLAAAHSSHHGNAYSAYAETGWNLSLRKCTLQPFTSLRYTFLDEEGYRESGADGVNLRVGDRRTDTLVSDLGLRLAYPFKKGTWLCIPEATIAWDHDFDIDDRHIEAAFDGSPAATFVADGRDIDEDGAVLGAGLTFINKGNVSISVEYVGELRSHYESHALTGGIRYEF